MNKKCKFFVNITSNIITNNIVSNKLQCYYSRISTVGLECPDTCTSCFKRVMCISCGRPQEGGSGLREQGKGDQKPDFLVDLINIWPLRGF